jgi:TonB-dependent starch-binding outer membrane protein SusC
MAASRVDGVDLSAREVNAMAISRSMLAGVALVLGAWSPLSARAAHAGAFLQQGATITGTVTSEGGSPLAYATVSLPRLNLTSTTDASGNYRLIVAGERLTPGADTLVVERLGYATTRVPVTLRAGDQRVDVQVASSALPLDEIVVTGTVGNQQRRAQPAVVATINAADIVDKAPVTGVTELLAGRTPGVSIVQASGTTGAASRINIRGQGSINLSNSPLVFIDGVRISAGARDAAANVGGQRIDGLSDLNPEDIESIEVVKGPAAATLYGADATAGVIQIITKRGYAGGRSFVQNLTTEYNHIDPNFTPATNYYRCSASDVAATSSVFLCQGRAAGDVVTDNPLVRQDAFNDGESKILRYTARGGGSDYGYFVSLGTDDETGTLRGNTLERRTGRVNFNWNPHPKVVAEAGIGLTRSEVALPMGDQSGQGYLIGSGFGTPRTVRQAADGSITGGWLSANESVESISSIENTNEATRVTPTATVRYQPMPWFTNQFTVGAEFLRQSRSTFYPRNDNGWYSVIQNTGLVARESADGNQYTLHYVGNLNGRFGTDDWISTDLSFGSQYIYESDRNVNASGTGLITNAANAVSQTSANRSGGESFGESKELGLFGQLMVGLHDRLFLKFAERVDRHSAFARNAETFLLPSVGVSWVASQEPFVQSFLPDAVSTLKLRAAYGETGRAPGSTAALQTYVPSPYVTDLGLLVVGGVRPGNPGNTELKPERGTELEAGFDIGLLRDRVGVELTYFDKTSKDLIVTSPLPPSAGFASSPAANIGELSNTGFELSARATLLDRRNVVWDVSMFMNTLENELVHVENISPLSDRRCFKPGVELAAFCVNRIIDVDTLTGRVTVTDTAEFLGGQIPKREGSLGTTLSLFQDFRIYAQADGKWDFLIYNFGREFRERLNGPNSNSERAVLTREELGLSLYEWYRLHPTSIRTESGANAGLTSADEDYFEDGSYVRFRELSLTWMVPASLVERVGLDRGTSITVGGRNLALWTDYLGYDPEVLAVDSDFFRADLFTVPQARRFFARLNIQF